MATNISVENVSPGFKYTVEAGMESFYDNNGDRTLDSPTTIVGGWAPTEEQAHLQAQQALESIDE